MIYERSKLILTLVFASDTASVDRVNRSLVATISQQPYSWCLIYEQPASHCACIQHRCSSNRECRA